MPDTMLFAWMGDDVEAILLVFAVIIAFVAIVVVLDLKGGPSTRQGGCPMSTIAATVRTADRVDHWIRRHVIPYCHGTDPSQSTWNPARHRRVGLSAIGQ